MKHFIRIKDIHGITVIAHAILQIGNSEWEKVVLMYSYIHDIRNLRYLLG